jgi:hypothetical protein
MTMSTDPGTRWVVILDHDAKIFQIEGPIPSDSTTHWTLAVRAAVAEGKKLQVQIELGSKDRKHLQSWVNGKYGYPETGTFRLTN